MLSIIVYEGNVDLFEVVDVEEPRGLSYAVSDCLLEAVMDAIDLFDGEELVELNYRCYKCSTCPLREE